MSICHSSLTKVTLRYIGQLLREGDWQQALLVSSYIPPSFTKTRKQVVYAIMMRNGAKLFKELGSESQSMLLKVIKVPREYFFSSRAVMHESLGNYECAMQDYHWSGNDNMAHKIFMKHIAPLYFTNPDDMSHLI